jgi:soluble lytic murein transglycosylase
MRSVLASLLGAAALAAAPSCESEARAWRTTAKSPQRAVLEQCAARLSSSPAGAAARLALAVSALEARRFAEVPPLLTRVRGQLGQIDDYAAFFHASALAGMEQHASAITALDPVWKQDPVSPVAGRAALLAAASYMALGKPAASAQILENHDSQLPQPAGAMALGEAWLGAGDLTKAGLNFTRVYFGYPQSAEAARVGAEWRVKGTPADYLLRVDRSAAGNAAVLRSEVLAASSTWSPAERELALVKTFELDYRARRYAAVRQGLAAMQTTAPEADAERSWWLYQTARRLDLDADRQAAFARISRHHPASSRHLDVLLAEGYRLLVDNKYEEYEPIYRACATHFERDPKAAFCHWKLVWSSYFRRRPDAEKLLREHMQRFPHSEKANTALYFLGRLAEQRGEHGAARLYYETIRTQFHHTYYALLAEDRLNDPRVRGAAVPAVARQFVAAIPWPARRPFSAEEAATAQRRRERASLLAMAGLDNYAEFELRMGAREEKAPIGLAMDLADHMTKVGQADKGLRYIKGLLPGYLFFPWEAAGERFWRLAFPLPFQDDVQKYAREHDVDAFIVAGLIRQESEFNPRVVSRAKAYGLTQILPSTGRDLSRRVGLRAFQPAMLFDPAVNLRLGTYYLKILMKSFEGRWEDVLAAYNGGGTRVRKWRGFGEFREQAEFIETIPFDETREYVQSVLRNAAVYRRLYDGKVAAINSSNEPLSEPRRASATKSLPQRPNR